MKRLISVIACAFCAISINAATIHVPADQPTVQAGIDVASNGDTVLVAEGSYDESGNNEIDFLGKEIVVISESGPDVTTIEVLRVNFRNEEDTSSILQGFTVRCSGVLGVYCDSSSPSIIDCKIVEGDGIFVWFGSPKILNCIIQENNFTSTFGGGMTCYYGSPRIINTLFYKNVIVDQIEGAYGGGLSCTDCSAQLINCTFYGNAAIGPWHCGDAIHVRGESAIRIENCIIVGEVCCDGEDCIESMSCTDAIPPVFGWAGINGNISSDPMFCDTAAGDFHIFDNSPCAAANNSCSTLIGALGVGCICCQNRGNADGEGGVNVADVTYLVDFLFFGGDTPPCPEEGNVDADGGINVADLTYLVEYIFFGGPTPPLCP